MRVRERGRESEKDKVKNFENDATVLTWKIILYFRYVVTLNYHE